MDLELVEPDVIGVDPRQFADLTAELRCGGTSGIAAVERHQQYVAVIRLDVQQAGKKIGAERPIAAEGSLNRYFGKTALCH